MLFLFICSLLVLNPIMLLLGLPRWLNGKESACQCKGDARDAGLIPGLGRSSGGGNGNLCICMLSPRESYRQRSLVGYSPQCHKELDMTEHISTHVIITVLFSQCLFIFAYIFITSIAFYSSHISHPFQASTCLGSFSTQKKGSLSFSLKYILRISFMMQASIVAAQQSQFHSSRALQL